MSTLPNQFLSFILLLTITACTSFAAQVTAVDPIVDDAQTQSTQTQAPIYAPLPVEGEDASAWVPMIDDHNEIEIRFSPLGAGIQELILLDEFETVKLEENIRLQQRVDGPNGISAVPFAMIGLEIDGSFVELSGAGYAYPVWEQLSPGVFECTIADELGNPIARVSRIFTMRDTPHAFVLEQRVENLSADPHMFRIMTTAMIDMPKAKNGYAGDRRRVRFGTLKSQEQQGNSIQVSVDDKLWSRNKLLGSKTKDANGNKYYSEAQPVWPTEQTMEKGQRLSWIGFSDRYFSVILHPMLDPLNTNPDDRLLSPSIASIDRFVLNTYATAPDTTIVLSATSPAITIEPGDSGSISNGIYAGPRTKPVFNEDPILAALNLPDMVVYNIGGFCAGCTFDWLTNILIAVLRIFHSMVGDWAVSIMLLVIVVRGCLHPITRWSQIRMQRFGVQMQSMAPKQKELREKYKDDPKKMQQEMSKLWREEGISPLGMLGCLPMLLQSPVWIALYATLFFAVELRHQPAFYGVFQDLTNGSWMFLSDLASADSAIPLPEFMHFSFPLWGAVTSINILPLLLGVVFFMHQKYLTPPTQATLTPEQESQQKMMKVMMVVMFPVMMYTAPSGLALYFLTNSTVGILENKWIRSHMKKHGMLEIENIRSENAKKGPGFLQRMNEAAEAKRQIMEKGPQQPNPASRRNQGKHK
ncbi:MAG: membrane protein insertase YidC [Phycisphaerales bacterium]|nr:membrane protein insertase YidC [Phycisphaerales bacterium]